MYSPAEAENISRLLASHISKLPYYQLIIDRDRILLPAEAAAFDAAEARLLRAEPLQYVLGEAWFRGKPYAVRPGVLIPRPETEELAGLCIPLLKDRPRPRILDIGTGSGCLAISLALEIPGADVYALDISDTALQTARKNAADLKARVGFFKADILRYAALPAGQETLHYDLIVSNPPYIPQSEAAGLHANVREHEPASALFVPDADPLLFYKAITAFASTHLQPGGWLAFETHADFADAVLKEMKRAGFPSPILHKDLSGRNRMAIAQMPA